MKVYKYQARHLLAEGGIPVPPGEVCIDYTKAAHLYKDVTSKAGTKLAVVKAQVHAGGRGKAGFVKLVNSPDEAEEAAKFMLSNRMVSVQTGPDGVAVKKLLIAAGVDIEKEFYLAITTDRARNTNTLIASAEGGVEIEQVAESNPDAIVKMPLHPLDGLEPYQAREIAFKLGFKGKQIGQAVKIMMNLAKLFLAKDCSLAEINPLIVTPTTDEHPDGQVMAIDAKFNFDDNALYRHADIKELFDPEAEDQSELRAANFGLSYIALDGNIGCLVNGAGLAMSTMDIIKLHGGEPANFLDVGGSGQGRARQHLRRDHAVRQDRPRDRERREGSRLQGAARCPTRRHERRRSAEDPRRSEGRHRIDAVRDRSHGCGEKSLRRRRVIE